MLENHLIGKRGKLARSNFCKNKQAQDQSFFKYSHHRLCSLSGGIRRSTICACLECGNVYTTQNRRGQQRTECPVCHKTAPMQIEGF